MPIKAAEMRIPFLDLAKANASLMQELEEASSRVIRSGRYLTGPETASLERELAELCGSSGAAGVSNGLDALRLITRSWIDSGKLRKGDEVIVPANTYIASVLPLTEFGLKVVPVDPSAETLNIDETGIREAISGKTRAVMLVHLYGTPATTPAFAAELRSEGLLVVEDCAQAIGAAAEGRPVGSWGDAAAFSFYPTKNIGAIGDAGAVVSYDEELLTRVKALANYGSDRRYHNVAQGYNCRMDEIQAAMLSVKLRHLNRETERRQSVAEAYSRTISHADITLPQLIEGAKQVWHQYIILSPRRDELRRYLADRGIGTDIHYPTPFYQQPCYRDCFEGSWPVTDRICRETVSLPIGSITAGAAEEIGQIINQF